MGYRRPKHSDKFWDLEATKLQLIDPNLAGLYSRRVVPDRYRGRSGLIKLGFSPDSVTSTIWGPELIAACKRIPNLCPAR